MTRDHGNRRVLIVDDSPAFTDALSRLATHHRVGVVARPLAADQVAEAVRALLEAPAGAGPVEVEDVPARFALLKADPDQPIHPLEAS